MGHRRLHPRDRDHDGEGPAALRPDATMMRSAGGLQPLLDLQRTVGNRAVAELVASRGAVATGGGPPVQRVGGRRAALGDVLALKVTIAGSGHSRWTGDKAKEARGEDTRWSLRKGGSTKPTGYVRTKSGATTAEPDEMLFSGPGAPDTTKRSPFGGMNDQGSNRIAQLVKHVPERVAERLEALRAVPGNEDKDVVILLRAHSRGAVAASQVSLALRARVPDAKIELVLFDPVPGPSHKGKNVKLDLSTAGLSEFTLVYSVASGYQVGFGPQAVYGAKRIIVSSQTHSGGKAAGFTYGGRVYKGSNLNSLPPGVYVDRNANGENKVPLRLVDDIDRARGKFQLARWSRHSKHGPDRNRTERITKVLEAYFRA